MVIFVAKTRQSELQKVTVKENHISQVKEFTAFLLYVWEDEKDSSLTLSDPIDCSLPCSSVHGDSPGKDTGVDSHALLQG